jgi:hypothetical protein
MEPIFMATSRRTVSYNRTGWRRLSAIELTLAVSVIIGLLFVSIRVKSIDWSAAGAKAGAIITGNETTPLAPQASGTNSP